MTDKEMAEQFADNINGLDLTCSLLSAKDKRHAYRLGRYDGFLAGLKAGRPQWHYVKDGDLPKHDHEVLCILWGDTREIGYYENEVWHFENFVADYEDVDYWQEIVPPKESE